MKAGAKPKRTARLTRASRGTAYLVITEGRKSAHYHLTPLRTDLGGIAYRFSKLVQDGGEVYSTCAIPSTGETHCECIGHARYGSCRHGAVLLALRNAGKL
jgi:hypothetical protein